jgi:hypothetical protein
MNKSNEIAKIKAKLAKLDFQLWEIELLMGGEVAA